MARTLAETEAELTLHQKRREVFERILSGSLSPAEEELERERLMAIGTELAALEEKRAPPPRQRVFPQAWDLSREAAAAKAAELRQDPRYFKGPGVQHPDGVKGAFTPAEHEVLVETVRDLMDRATEPE